MYGSSQEVHMSDFFRVKGTLSVSIGEGWLSSFQASNLKRGDVVRSTHIAGTPSPLFFNGVKIGLAEVVVLGEIFGARIVGVPIHTEPSVEPGIKDDLIELLPTMIRLGSIQVSLEDLKGVGPQSIISLGKPLSTDEDCELVVAGLPAARGRVVVLGEEMGMRITRAYGTAFKETNIRSSRFLVEKDSPGVKIKDYDFKKPDKFTWAAIMKIAEVHGHFLRNLAVRLPETSRTLATGAESLFVDQCTYGEALEMLPEKAFGRFAAENASWRPTSAEEAASVHPSNRMLLEEEGTAHPLPGDVRAAIERYWGESGGMLSRNPIFFFHGEALKTLFAGRDGREALLSCLRGGWKNVVDLNLKPYQAAAGAPDFPELNQYEMVVIVGVKDRHTGKPAMAILYPYLTLEPYLGILG
jgi:flagellar motor switch/type III secretory pathway protein FliN